MLENLKNQERLSPEEENRIEKWIRIAILIGVICLAAVIIWAAFHHKTFGTLYYASILIMLAAVWFVQYVLAAILKHSLAQRSDEQVSAYLKAAGLELVAYAGLAWFLLSMNGNSIFGAVVYMFAVMGARKQKEIYAGTNDEENADSADSPSPSPEGNAPDEEAGVSAAQIQPAVPDALPSAADRQEREKERESEDGSV